MARGIVRRGFSRGLRRKTSWGFGPSSGATPGAAQSLAASSAIIMTTGTSPSVDGITVVRVRGELLLQLSAAAADLDGFHGAFGIGVLSGGQRGFTGIGVGAVPIPLTNDDDETWIWHQYFALKTVEGAVPVNTLGSSVTRIQVDSKAMRKVDTGDLIYAAIEVVEVGTAVLQIHFNTRVLAKLA